MHTGVNPTRPFPFFLQAGAVDAIPFTLKSALHLLSNRHILLRVAHVLGRVYVATFFLLLTAITIDLTIKPGRTLNTRLGESKLKLSFIMSRSTKVISTR